MEIYNIFLTKQDNKSNLKNRLENIFKEKMLNKNQEIVQNQEILIP